MQLASSYWQPAACSCRLHFASDFGLLTSNCKLSPLLFIQKIEIDRFNTFEGRFTLFLLLKISCI